MNLAHEFVASLGKCIPGCREEYDDACIDFAGDFVDSEFGQRHGARLAYFETPLSPRWRYHAAPLVGDMVHCLWHEDAMALSDYMTAIGATEVDFPAGKTEAQPL